MGLDQVNVTQIVVEKMKWSKQVPPDQVQSTTRKTAAISNPKKDEKFD